MKAIKISDRGIMFFIETGYEWNLNCYLIKGNRANYIIDTGRGETEGNAIARYIEANCAKLPTVVINTHSHWDHVWGNSVFADSVIISGGACRQRVAKEFDTSYRRNKKYSTGRVILTLPNLTFSGSLALPSDRLVLYETLGHTDDGICVLDQKDGVLYVGDNIGDTVECPVPELELPKSVYEQELEKLKKLDFSVLASGHNEILNKNFLDKIISCLNG